MAKKKAAKASASKGNPAKHAKSAKKAQATFKASKEQGRKYGKRDFLLFPLIGIPSGLTNVVRVVGDNYTICPQCGGDAPAMNIGGADLQPTEAFTRINYPPVATLPSSPALSDLPASFNATQTLWYHNNRELTTTNLGRVHQFVIWFKYVDPAMGTEIFSLPDSWPFTPNLVAVCP
jgi:hypothetical protein